MNPELIKPEIKSFPKEDKDSELELDKGLKQLEFFTIIDNKFDHCYENNMIK